MGVQVTVPPGAISGQLISFPSPADGVTVMQAVIPMGLVPGDVFEVMEQKQTITCVVPNGAAPGQLVLFPAPDGSQMKAVIPPGHWPGQSFQVECQNGAQAQQALQNPRPRKRTARSGCCCC